MNFSIPNNRKGFTLIELLLVISVVGLLSSIVLASLSRARDKSKIAAGQLFDGSIYHVIGDELAGYWPLEESSGAAYDQAGTNNGTRYGTVPSISGVIGNAASFNGNSANYIYLGNNSSLQITGSETISLWLYPTSFSARRNPIAKAYGGEGTITQEINGSLTYFYGTAGANASPYQTFGMTSSLQLNKWTHIALVRDLVKMKLYWYKDGNLVNQANAAYANATPSALDLMIGRGYTSNYSGYIDEVKIYRKPIPLSQIQNLFAEGLAKKKLAVSK